jgi:hypothetical protein
MRTSAVEQKLIFENKLPHSKLKSWSEFYKKSLAIRQFCIKSNWAERGE